MKERTAADLLKLNKITLHNARQRLVLFVSFFVVIGVFWCLKLTGITMAGEAFCGMKEHHHGENCITEELICTIEETDGHTHDESCILREVLCGKEEMLPHVHDDSCLFYELICTEPEIEAHFHNDACHERILVCNEEEMEGHVHNENCIASTLICTEKEREGHRHNDRCHEKIMVCTKEVRKEHLHDDSCFETSLICTEVEREKHIHNESCHDKILTCKEKERIGHRHKGDCFKSSLVCKAVEEDHVHGAECYEDVLICTEHESEGHSHGTACYILAEELNCGREETMGHSHSSGCYESVQVCPLKEAEGHQHDVNCYILAEELNCGQAEDEGHSHNDNCFKHSVSCALKEFEGHSHKDDCYVLGEGICCGLEETEGHTHGELCFILIEDCFLCGQEETEGHSHVDECYGAEIGFGCGRIEEERHTHGETCYVELMECPLEEHVHVESCYSDINADVENEDEWEDSLPDRSEMYTTGETLIAIAQSQLGYTESTLNFQVDLHGVRRGITRYGQWYGNPYGDWSAMFASFCLHYAGAEDLPGNAGPESMRSEWEKEGLYESVEFGLPEEGNLIFLSEDPTTEEKTTASAVAIVTNVTGTSITLIQGDFNDTVSERSLEMDDPTILGYGLVPEYSPFALLMSPQFGELSYLGKTIDYNSNMFTSGRSFVIYAEHGGMYYALISRPASGMETTVDAVPIAIENGNIYTDVENTDSLLWNFGRSGNNYTIQNVATNRYLHPGGDYGVIYDRNWPTALVASGRAAKLVHTDSNNNVGIFFNGDQERFEIIRNKSGASNLYFGVVERNTIYLDGTNGNLMSLAGSDTDSFSVISGSTITLPSQWPSPEKYDYTLKGWYDVGNRTYYNPGDEVKVTENMLFYADWIGSTYDIGQMNSDVVDTVSTNDFITTHLFDYNSLFNTLSMNNNYTGGDNARWTLVEDGTVQVTGDETLNFIFVDYDDPGNPGAISYPIGRNQENGVDYSRVTSGLYNEELVHLLFDTEEEVVGKHYLGKGDQLFQYGADPSDTEHYGYYYYDSMLNAASYHQSNERFYVYNYLERTVDSAGNNSYSDFLPLNSPYANTNGNATGTYNYNGVHNEYVGTPHISYDSKYSDNNNSPNRVITNYWFGMTMEMDFYLPSKPGTVDGEGVLANQSIAGDDMVFEFSGDDDVWVLIDGELVLDIGGIHGVEAGSIDFSTGDVIVDGVKTGSVTNLSSGSHTLTMYYLERGSSMSNFKLRFNLSPRYSMNLRKEDTLTAHLLDGAQFAIYTDEDCTHPAEFWNSKDEHEKGLPSTNVFTVENGIASMWGLAAGNTYYLEEVRGPDAMQGVPAQGIIRMRLNNQGQPDYEVIPDIQGDLTVGYMVHGYKVNEDLQEAYLVITNTDATDSEPTQVYVEKVWGDTKNHSEDEITAYLLANGVRIQSVTLNESNDWKHLWVNLPSEDRNGVPVTYTVREATVPGYVGNIEAIEAPSSGSDGSGSGGGSGGVTSATAFVDGETYLLHTRFGYISASGNRIQFEGDQSNALNSNTTQWVANVHDDNTVTLTNKAGQTLYYQGYEFLASSTPGTYKNLSFSSGKLYWSYDHGSWVETVYPIDNDDVGNNAYWNGKLYSTGNSSQAMTITPQKLGYDEPEQPDLPEGDGTFYRITNIPAGEATISLQVKKLWDLGTMGDSSQYEELGIQMRLLADGEDAGLVGVLNLRNNWSYTFDGLPKYDNNGDEISYTVEEINLPVGWKAEYGPIKSIGGSETAYETTVININHMSVELPTTGGIGPYGYMAVGILIIIVSLVWYYGQKRKDGRRVW